MRRRVGARRLALFALPTELLERVVHNLLNEDLGAAFQLAQTCHGLRWQVRELAKPRRLRWRGDQTYECAISPCGTRITRKAQSEDWAWAAGGLLPTNVRSTWRVRVERNYQNTATVMIGVSDATNRFAWGIFLATGTFMYFHRLLDKAPLGNWEVPITVRGGTDGPHPPPGYPRRHNVPFMRDDAGEATNLTGRALHTEIEVTVDAAAGTLAFRIKGINGGESTMVTERFPRNVGLRPWAMLDMMHWDGRDPGDQLSISKFRSGDSCDGGAWPC